MKQAINEFTRVQVEKFQRTNIGNKFHINKIKYTVHETPFLEHICSLCTFNQMGYNCPRQTGEKTPVCFAKNRPDRKSVYYTKNEVKILIWEKD